MDELIHGTQMLRHITYVRSCLTASHLTSHVSTSTKRNLMKGNRKSMMNFSKTGNFEDIDTVTCTFMVEKSAVGQSLAYHISRTNRVNSKNKQFATDFTKSGLLTVLFHCLRI